MILLSLVALLRLQLLLQEALDDKSFMRLVFSSIVLITWTLLPE